MRGFARVLAGDGGEGGGDGFRAAVQDAQQLPVGPLARGGRVAGVQGGGGLAEVAADVDVVDEDRDLQAAFPRLGLDGGDLLLVPVGEEDPLAGALRVAAAGLVIGGGDHVLNALGDRRGHPFVPGFRAWVRLAAGGRGGDVPRLAGGGGEVGDGDDLGHLLDPGAGAVFLPGVPAVLRAHRDALAVALHHDHVAVRQVRVRVPGPLGAEVVRPGREVPGEPGELGAADRDAGAGLDDLLGLPEPAAGQVEGRQGPHPQGVRVVAQDLPGVGGVQVRLAPVPAGHPGDPDRPEHAGHAPPVPGLDDAVPDPGRADDRLGRALLAGGIDVERGLQHQPLQLAALFPDHLLPLPVIAEPGLARRPGGQPGELLRRGGQRRRQLPLQRSLAPVVEDLPHRHRELRRHRRASGFLPGMISRHPPGNAPGTRATCDGTSSRPCPELTITITPDQCESQSVMPGMPCNTPDSPDTK